MSEYKNKPVEAFRAVLMQIKKSCQRVTAFSYIAIGNRNIRKNKPDTVIASKIACKNMCIVFPPLFCNF